MTLKVEVSLKWDESSPGWDATIRGQYESDPYGAELSYDLKPSRNLTPNPMAVIVDLVDQAAREFNVHPALVDEIIVRIDAADLDQYGLRGSFR